MREHPLENMTAQGIERVVDFYARGGQLAGIAFCVNMQKALFESQAWETLIDDYDPGLGEDQPALQSGEARGMARLKQNGVDQFKVWITRARHHGLEAFLSMRMNDCHGLEGHGDFWTGHRQKGLDQDHFSGHHALFWKTNPQFRRAPYRYERSFEGALDFGHADVRQRQIALIAELFERYDMDGLELDWMRWIFMFAPGGEEKGLGILNDFVAEVGAMRNAAEKRWGHGIQLRHRIPAEPQTCLALGYDIPSWARRGLADQIILSSFGSAANFDYPIRLWRDLMGSQVRILALVEPHVMASPGSQVHSYHFLFAAAASALRRGADGVYLFNECYRESSGVASERALLGGILDHIGDLDTLDHLVRRHSVSFPQVRAPGEPRRVVLPIPLHNRSIGWDPGRWAENITLRISLGRIQPEADYVLCLGFSEEAEMHRLQEMTVRVNTVPMISCTEPDYRDCMKEAFPEKRIARYPADATRFLFFRPPREALQHDTNVVEFEPPPISGALEWAEFVVRPTEGTHSISTP